MTLESDHGLLAELESRAGELLERHLQQAKEWFSAHSGSLEPGERTTRPTTNGRPLRPISRKKPAALSS